MDGRIGYTTEPEATALIAAYIPSGDRRRGLWEGLSAQDRVAWLRQAELAIKASICRGGHENSGLSEAGAGPSGPGRGAGCQTLEERTLFKMAQALEAAELAVEGGSAERRGALRRSGVAAYSVGGLTERLAAGGGDAGLLSGVARRVLRPYLGGGCSIV